jgi:hypothetical protein
MSEYKGIKGFQVQTRTEDPVPYAQALADNPYAGSWSSGGNLNTAKRQGAGFGTLTAGVYAGGNNPSPTTANVEEYNGTAWSEVNDMPTSHFALASSRNSPQTSGIVFGGTDPSNSGVSTESDSYDGTNWTETAEINTGRKQLGGAGSSSTAALAFSGNPGPGILTELWNGSSWTEVNDLNAQKQSPSYFGTSTAAIAAQGNPPATTTVESWNGTSWTEVAEMNTQRSRGAGMGTTTDGLVGGGLTPAPGNTAATEAWNGSVWTEVNDMGSARHELASGGTGSTGWAAGGYTSTEVASTEEWTFSGLPPSTPAADYSNAIIGDFYYNSTTGQFKDIFTGVGAWASSANLPSGKMGYAGGGSMTAAIVFGGNDSTSTDDNKTYEYNGSSWSEGGDMSEGVGYGGGGGIQTSAVSCGGYTGTVRSNCEEYNGTSWTTGGSLNTGRYNMGATVVGQANTNVNLIGGNIVPAPATAVQENYNGTAWTEIADLPSASYAGQATGTTTASIYFGGTGYSGTGANFDGSSWTTNSATMNTDRTDAAMSGSTTSAIIYGAGPPGKITELFDGTSWTEVGDLGTANPGKMGRVTTTTSNTEALSYGGYSTPVSPSGGTVTETWNLPDFTTKTVTTS